MQLCPCSPYAFMVCKGIISPSTSHLCPLLPRGLFHLGFSTTKPCMHFSSFPFMPHSLPITPSPCCHTVSSSHDRPCFTPIQNSIKLMCLKLVTLNVLQKQCIFKIVPKILLVNLGLVNDTWRFKLHSTNYRMIGE